MERRRYARIAVNLNVALLDERAMPRGCRVRDVSQGGMLLQFEHAVGDGTFEIDDTVKVRVSLKEGNDRTVLLLPATIKRMEEKGLSVAFLKPAAELMQLVEPYELDNPRVAETAVAAAAAGHTAAGSTQILAAAQPQRPRNNRRGSSARAQLAERIAGIRAAVYGAGEVSAESPVQAASRPGDRRMLQVGLASLAIAVAVVAFDLATASSTQRRLSMLEETGSQQAETLAGLQIRLTADKGQETRVAELNTRIDELAVALAALESGHFTAAGGDVHADTPPPHQASQPETVKMEQTSRAAPGTAANPDLAKSGHTGPWVLNLVSLFDQTAADQFADKARSAGIPAEVSEALANDKPVWRLQVSGFASREAADRYANANKKRLGLKNVWIFKR